MSYQRKRVKLFDGTDISRSTNVTDQTCVNWYPEDGRTVLYPTPGSKQVIQVIQNGESPPTYPISGMAVDLSDSSGVIWLTSGDHLFKLTPSEPGSGSPYVVPGYWEFGYTNIDEVNFLADPDVFTLEDIGVMTGFPTDKPVRILVDNMWVFIMVLGDGENWTYNKVSTTLAEQTDTDHPYYQTPSLKLSEATWMDHYWIVSQKDSGNFWVSDLNDARAWTATNFANAEKSPDPLVSIISHNKELWLLGKTTVEVWYDSGDLDFPFEPIPNAFFDIGCLSPGSVCSLNNVLTFLAQDKSGFSQIVSFSGMQMEVISNTHIEDLLNKNLRHIDLTTNWENFGYNICAYAYKERGHSFYVLTIPASLIIPTGLTLVYDFTTKKWHTRSSTFDDPDFNEITGRHFSGETFAMSRYKFWVGNYTNEYLYKLDIREYNDFVVRDENGVMTSNTNINRSRISQFFEDVKNRIFWHSIEIECEVGVVKHSDGTKPQLTLYFSDDKGNNWINVGSKTIQSGVRMKWNRLGSSHKRIWKIETSDDANIVLIDAVAEISREVTESPRTNNYESPASA